MWPRGYPLDCRYHDEGLELQAPWRGVWDRKATKAVIEAAIFTKKRWDILTCITIMMGSYHYRLLFSNWTRVTRRLARGVARSSHKGP